MLDFEKIKLIYSLSRHLKLSDIQVLLQAAQRQSYPVGAQLIRVGSVQRAVFFVRKGLVRAFQINNRGDEVTTLIRQENQFVVSPDVLLFDQPSQAYFETLEPTEVFYIDYDVLQAIVTKYPRLEANRRFILLNMLKELSHRLHSFVLQTPEERYLSFVEENPDLTHRVPDKYIANILGITPVSLSRIRKRIASKKK
jgi:CRP-like cAMP-binding protein